MGEAGKLTISPSAAHTAAHNIRSRADNINEILNRIKGQMEQIDDKESGIYEGTAKAQALREELANIIAVFQPIYDRLIEFADDIDNIAEETAKA